MAIERVSINDVKNTELLHRNRWGKQLHRLQGMSGKACSRGRSFQLGCGLVVMYNAENIFVIRVNSGWPMATIQLTDAIAAMMALSSRVLAYEFEGKLLNGSKLGC